MSARAQESEGAESAPDASDPQYFTLRSTDPETGLMHVELAIRLLGDLVFHAQTGGNWQMDDDDATAFNALMHECADALSGIATRKAMAVKGVKS